MNRGPAGGGRLPVLAAAGPQAWPDRAGRRSPSGRRRGCHCCWPTTWRLQRALRARGSTSASGAEGVRKPGRGRHAVRRGAPPLAPGLVLSSPARAQPPCAAHTRSTSQQAGAAPRPVGGAAARRRSAHRQACIRSKYSWQGPMSPLAQAMQSAKALAWSAHGACSFTISCGRGEAGWRGREQARRVGMAGKGAGERGGGGGGGVSLAGRGGAASSGGQRRPAALASAAGRGPAAACLHGALLPGNNSSGPLSAHLCSLRGGRGLGVARPQHRIDCRQAGWGGQGGQAGAGDAQQLQAAARACKLASSWLPKPARLHGTMPRRCALRPAAAAAAAAAAAGSLALTQQLQHRGNRTQRPQAEPGARGQPAHRTPAHAPARCASALPVPSAMPCATMPPRPAIMPPPCCGIAGGGGAAGARRGGARRVWGRGASPDWPASGTANVARHSALHAGHVRLPGNRPEQAGGASGVPQAAGRQQQAAAPPL